MCVGGGGGGEYDTDRQTETATEYVTDRQTDRQTDRDTKRETESTRSKWAVSLSLERETVHLLRVDFVEILSK